MKQEATVWELDHGHPRSDLDSAEAQRTIRHPDPIVQTS